jgi:ferric-dicitrate binding protein FerR (iron transport regulator)
MAYDDENAVRTSLLEGSIQFASGTQVRTLIPGQQTELNVSGELKLVEKFNEEEVISWKNGFFQFEGVDISTITRQLARWYDVEVVYKTKIENSPLYAEFPRNIKLSSALTLLEHATDAKFHIEGNKIIVN